jgi:hypothetical protein
MAAGGVSVNWSNGGTKSCLSLVLSGANRFSPNTEDFSVGLWATIDGVRGAGDNGSSDGDGILCLDNSGDGGSIAYKSNDCDPSFQTAPWTQVVEVNQDSGGSYANSTFGGSGADAIATGTPFYVAIGWNHTTHVLTSYFCLDQGSTPTSTNSSAVSLQAGNPLDTLRVLAHFGNNGSRVSVRCFRGFKANLSTSEWTTERKSLVAVRSTNLHFDYHLEDTSHLTDSHANLSSLSSSGTVSNASMDPVDLRSAVYKGSRAYILG